MDIGSIISNFKLKSIKAMVLRERIGKVDLGILKVALMVAALDGEVTDAEYAAFDALAKKCRGYTPKNAAVALDEAMHSAGYLMLLAKRVKVNGLVKAFLAEARKALPNGFAYCSIEDVRRAIVTWIAVGMCDGDYSALERACIEALRREFAEITIRRNEEAAECWSALAPTFHNSYGTSGRVPLIEKSFVTRVEEFAAKLGDSKTAAAELQRLVRE